MLRLVTGATIKAEIQTQSVLCLVVETYHLSGLITKYGMFSLRSLYPLYAHTLYLSLHLVFSVIYTLPTEGSLTAKYYFSAELPVRYQNEV